MTKYLEDYVLETEFPETERSRDAVFLKSIGYQILHGHVLTMRQTAAVRTIFSKMLQNGSIVSRDLAHAVDENRWRTTPRVSTERRREARYLGSNHILISGAVGDPNMNKALNKMHTIFRNKMAVVSVSRHNIDELISFLGKYEFEIDRELEDYLALCLGSKNKISHFIAVEDDFAINVCDDEALVIYLRYHCGAIDL